MSDLEIPGDKTTSGQAPSEDVFFERMRSEAERGQEWSAAFHRALTDPPSLSEIVEGQQKQAHRLGQLQRTVKRLRRSLLVSNLIAGAALLTTLAILALFVVNPPLAQRLAGGGQQDASGLERRSLAEADPPEYVLESDPEFHIRTDVDRKYQLLVRELYNRALTMRRPRGQSIGGVVGSMESHVNLMADLSRTIEAAEAEQPSPEISQALTNLAVFARERRRAGELEELSADVRDRMDQIQSVLRAVDARPGTAAAGR